MPVIDLFKAVASQLIVLHHLAYYGPMSDAAAPLAPALIGWLGDQGRLAVQVFFVIGGFLSARAMSPLVRPDAVDRLVPGRALRAFVRRYRRLALPFLCALALALVGAAIARGLIQHDSIPAAPAAMQLLAHALLLQDVLGHEALSAGSWYVAIDLQLFGLMLLAVLLGQRLGAPWLPTLALAMASLFVFNRDAQWDVCALYFFGSYALGVFAWQAPGRDRPSAAFAILVLAALASLAIDFRIRIAVALGVALVLAVAGRSGAALRYPGARIGEALGRISYSVFLVHFPVCLVVNAIFAR